MKKMQSVLDISRIIKSIFLIFLLFANILFPVKAQEHLASGSNEALHRGIYEIELIATGNINNPFFDTSLEVNFTRPDESTVTVDGFFNGNNAYKARAYCDQVGEWS
ncbi:hypothetical protein BH23BAC1_BH23BAC1_22760 [soil metagenome]